MSALLVLVLSLAVLCVNGQDADRCDAIVSQLEELEEENVAMKAELQKIRASPMLAGPFLFSAVKTASQAVTSGDNILFETELIDTHDTFNTIFGIYVIPEAGIYEVTVTLFKPASTSTAYNSLYGDLYTGTTFLARIYNYYGSDTGATSHSMISIIQPFNASDTLHVQSASSGTFYGSTSFRSSQFSAKYLGTAP